MVALQTWFVSNGRPCGRARYRKMAVVALGSLLALLTRTGRAAGSDPTFEFRAPKHSCVNAFMTIPVPKAFAAKVLASPGTRWALHYDGGVGGRGADLLCQFQTQNGQTTMSFVLPHIARGQTWPYHLVSIPGNNGGVPNNPGVQVAEVGTDIEIKTQGKLFTRYTTHSGPNKPFFYPILNSDDQPLTRRWPVEPQADPAESHDHPHHRGLWFTHSSLNGVDFWTEVETEKVKLGKTVNTGFSNLISGPVFGEFQAATDWITPSGKRIATDVRTIRVYSHHEAFAGDERVLDFTITIKPDGGPLLFGDNKDGVFGLRLPDSMAVNPSVKPARPGTGHYINSAGDKDGAAWGKAAEWVDYWGPVGGKTWGVAMFDDPKNFRHPETWHARDYALFTVNPFALHDFNLGPKDAGNYTVPVGASLTLHYRLLFHPDNYSGTPIADRYAAFTDPPEVEAHWDGKKK
ncbi:MAG: hypothetical protein JWN14_4955 [Chthonomonadales bacterium]|nr:hypothetical protein [Chthonomonadales bacterium]